jgi:hypothetical protein
VGHRRYPGQARDLAPIEGAELGQLGQERGDQHRADARYAAEQGCGGPELRVAGDGLAQERVELGLLLAQPLERRLGALDQRRRAQVAELLAAGGDLVQELAAVAEQLGQGRAARRAPASAPGGRRRRTGRSPRRRADRSWRARRLPWRSGAPARG